MAKKISSATIKEIIKENKKEDKKFILKTANAEIEVVIKPYISYQERTQMVNDIANNCYDENGDYHPEFFDIAYKIALIEYYTNINTDIQDSVNQMHILCDCTNIIDKIEASVKQVLDIKKDSMAIIEHHNSLKGSPWDSVAYLIMDILDKFSNSVDKNMDKLGDIKPEDMKNILGLVKKLTNMDDGAIIDNILKFRDETAEK